MRYQRVIRDCRLKMARYRMLCRKVTRDCRWKVAPMLIAVDYRRNLNMSNSIGGGECRNPLEVDFGSDPDCTMLYESLFSLCGAVLRHRVGLILDLKLLVLKKLLLAPRVLKPSHVRSSTTRTRHARLETAPRSHYHLTCLGDI